MQPRVLRLVCGAVSCEARTAEAGESTVGIDDTGQNESVLHRSAACHATGAADGVYKNCCCAVEYAVTGAEGSVSKHPGQQVWWLRQYCNPGRTAGVKILFGTVLCNPALRPADSSTLQVAA